MLHTIIVDSRCLLRVESAETLTRLDVRRDNGKANRAEAREQEVNKSWMKVAFDWRGHGLLFNSLTILGVGAFLIDEIRRAHPDFKS